MEELETVPVPEVPEEAAAPEADGSASTPANEDETTGIGSAERPESPDSPSDASAPEAEVVVAPEANDAALAAPGEDETTANGGTVHAESPGQSPSAVAVTGEDEAAGAPEANDTAPAAPSEDQTAADGGIRHAESPAQSPSDATAATGEDQTTGAPVAPGEDEAAADGGTVHTEGSAQSPSDPTGEAEAAVAPEPNGTAPSPAREAETTGDGSAERAESPTSPPSDATAPANEAESAATQHPDAIVPAADPAPEDAPTEPTAETQLSMEELLAESPPTAPQVVEDAQLRAVLEAIIYVAEEPLTLAQLAAALHEPAERIRALLEQLAAEFDKPEHGITVREVAGGYKMATKPEHHEGVRTFVKSLKPPLKLSLAALETLAVIAYKQPVTAPEIMEIRGVQGAGVLKTLLDRKLIAVAGRKNVIGKPILYKTTKDFLIQFGLKDLSELPSLKEFEEIRRMALSEGDVPSTEPPAVPPETPPAAESAAEPPSGQEP